MRDTNSLHDEIVKTREQMNQWSSSKKMQYFWDYYRYHVIIILVLSVLLGYFIHGFVTKKETVLSIAYINAFPNVEDELFIEDFEHYLSLNQKKQEVLLDSGYYIDNTSSSPYAEGYHQKFLTKCMAGMLDVVLADEQNFTAFAEEGFFTDLSSLMTNDELEKYSSQILWIDLPTDQRQEPVPVGIHITYAPKIAASSSYADKNAYYGIVSCSQHQLTSLSFLHYIYQ